MVIGVMNNKVKGDSEEFRCRQSHPTDFRESWLVNGAPIFGPDGEGNSCALDVGEKGFAVGAEAGAGPFAAFLTGNDVPGEAMNAVAATTE